MIKSVLAELPQYLKKFYFKLLVFIAPFIIVAHVINYQLRIYNENFLIELLLIFTSALVIDFLILLGLIKIRNLEDNSTNSNIMLSISVEINKILKIIFKKVITCYGLFYIFFIGLYFMVKWFLVYPIYVFENVDNPFPKSEKLVKYNSLMIFLLLFIGFVIYFFGVASLVVISKQFNYWGFENSTVIMVIGGFFSLIAYPIALILNYRVYVYLNDNYNENSDMPKIKALYGDD